MLAAIALGSNITSRFGDPTATVHEAVSRFAAIGTVSAVSSFYATEPVGYLDQPKFVNAAALLKTTLEPMELLKALLAMEQAMGRDRSSAPPKGPRIIDLDLLLCLSDDGHAMTAHEDLDLILPHPAMHERRFVLAPLAEIAPGWLHPGTQQTITQMLQALA